MSPDINQTETVSLALTQGSLADRLVALLKGLQEDPGDSAFTLDELSLTLGQRLPDVAQTATYWQRGELGRGVRRLGFGVRVEYGRVIFVSGQRDV